MNVRYVLEVTALAACVAVNAETYRTNTVEGLVYLLSNHNSVGDVIELEPGDYQMPEEPTYAEPNYGRSSIHVDKQTIRGLGTTPAAVRLVGSGKHRVVRGESTSTLENLTITGGYTDNSERTTYDYSIRCAGYYGNGILRNCIIKGNSAYHSGGGVYGDATSNVTLYDCVVEDNEARASFGGGGRFLTAYRTVFRNNRSKTDGGAVCSATLYDCVLSNNIAGVGGVTGNGGGGYNVKYASNTLFACNAALNGGAVANGTDQDIESFLLDDCVVSNNIATGTAPLTSGMGGGLFRQVARNCTITANTASLAGGAYMGSMTNCVISRNVARTYANVKVGSVNCMQSGGGAYNCSLIGCTVIGNQACGNGGGVCCDDDDVVVSNCVIAANVCSNSAYNALGGGMKVDAGTVVQCEIYGNAALAVQNSSKSGYGGGVASNTGNGSIRSCLLHDNYSSSYGGGAYMMQLQNCVVSNNVGERGANADNSHFVGGEVIGTPVAYGSAYGTVFHGVGKKVSLYGNPYHSETKTYGNVYAYYPNCTNCLFRDNRMPTGGSSSMFSSQPTSAYASSLVNCTVVSNDCVYMFRYFDSEAFPMTVENCIFVGNSTGVSACDIGAAASSAAGLRFSNCAYGVSALADIDNWFDGGNYRLGVDGLPSDPGFALSKDPAHPYALKVSSGLIGLAQVADWMEDAYDIRGEADGGKYRRLRDGKADLGCYQCWYDFIGTCIIFR